MFASTTRFGLTQALGNRTDIMANVNPEDLAYWYLRLNGFLTIPNFVVHSDSGRNQETDADILGVRFPFRAENLSNPMKDDPLVIGDAGKPHIVIAEVKTGRCNLNGPWTQPHRKNMVRVLRAIGQFKFGECDRAAAALYETGHYSNQQYKISLLCFGREVNTEVKHKYPIVRQILWPDVLTFIYNRFRDYRRQKASHLQWDQTGHLLWNTSEASHSPDVFLENMQVRGD